MAKRRKPPASAWALNRVARDDPDTVARALEAGAELRAATDAALGGDASGLRDATAAEKAASKAVVDAAVKALGSKGSNLRQRVEATLRAAVLDEALADQLRRGVLDADHDQPGLGFGGLVDVPAPAPARAARKPAKKKAAKAAPADGEAPAEPEVDEAALEAEREAERRAAEEAAAAEERRRRRAELEQQVERLEKRADRLATKADRLEAEAEAARSEADAAALEAEAARHELDQL